MAKVMLGMSGGVDSSAAAVILKNAGHTVAGVTLKLFGDGAESQDIIDARAVCQKLGIEHFVLDIRDTFGTQIIKYFIDSYVKGSTPNPCILCNKKIKFGEMLQFALKSGFDYIATGHYANIEKLGGRFVVKKAFDLAKDQSYVLYTLSQEQLSHIMLPLGSIKKEDARLLAEQNGLITAHKSDSQDVCFIPDGDYAAFIEKALGKKFQKGDYLDTSGNVIGKHEGVIHYTIGQRRGLNIALGARQFVIEKNAPLNTVTIGDEEHIFYRKVIVNDINLQKIPCLEGELRAFVKLRYRHKEQPAVITHLDEASVMVEFDEPQRAPTAGQSAVFYDGDTVIGGGNIVRGVKDD